MNFRQNHRSAAASLVCILGLNRLKCLVWKKKKERNEAKRLMFEMWLRTGAKTHFESEISTLLSAFQDLWDKGLLLPPGIVSPLRQMQPATTSWGFPLALGRNIVHTTQVVFRLKNIFYSFHKCVVKPDQTLIKQFYPQQFYRVTSFY